MSATPPPTLRPDPQRTHAALRDRPFTVDDLVAFDAGRPFASRKPLANIMQVQWISPMMWRSYSTQWNLLFHLEMAARNVDDDYNDPVGTVPSKLMVAGGAPVDRLTTFPDALLLPAEMRTLDDREWFYTVRPEGTQPRWFDQRVLVAASSALLGDRLDDTFWKRFAPGAYPIGITSPDPGDLAWIAAQRAATGDRLNRDWISRWVAWEIYHTGSGRHPPFNPKNDWPSVTTDLGERAVVFTSLAKALRFLEANPQKPVWIMAFDAPEHPAKYKQPSENGLWLVLTHPDYTGHPYPRKPLATIHAPQRVSLADVPSGHRAAAHRKALADAAGAMGLTLPDIGMVFHDAGRGEAMGRAIAPLMQAMTELGIESVPDRLWNVDKYLQNAGAAAAAMNIAFATTWSHYRGQPAMVVATREADAVYAVTIAPPAGHVPPALRSHWPRARALGFAYYPWWGERIERARK